MMVLWVRATIGNKEGRKGCVWQGEKIEGKSKQKKHEGKKFPDQQRKRRKRKAALSEKISSDYFYLLIYLFKNINQDKYF